MVSKSFLQSVLFQLFIRTYKLYRLFSRRQHYSMKLSLNINPNKGFRLFNNREEDLSTKNIELIAVCFLIALEG